MHPWKTEGLEEKIDEIFQKLEQKLKKYQKIGIGEIGLDGTKNIPMEIQEKVFFEQLKFANKYKRPVSLHCVKEYDLLLKNLKTIKLEQKNFRFMIHSFNSSIEIMNEFIKLGGYISFSPRILDAKKFEDLIKNTPNDRILLESDLEFKIEDLEKDWEQYIEKLKKLYEKVAIIKSIETMKLEKIIFNNFQKFVIL